MPTYDAEKCKRLASALTYRVASMESVTPVVAKHIHDLADALLAATQEVERLRMNVAELDEEETASLRHFYGVHGHEFCAYCAKAKAFLEGVIDGAMVEFVARRTAETPTIIVSPDADFVKVELQRLRNLVRDAAYVAERTGALTDSDRDDLAAIRHAAGLGKGE